MIARRWYTPILLFTGLVLLLCSCGSSEDTPEAATATAEPTAAVPTVGPTVTSTVSLIPPGMEVALQYIVRMDGAVLARVNGEAITWEDYEPGLHQMLLSANQQNVNWHDPAMQERLKLLQNDVLEQTVDRWLLRQLATEQGIILDEGEVEQAVQDETSEILGSGRYPDWSFFLEMYGLTDDSFRVLISERLLLDELMARQEVETTGEQIHIRHIVVGNEAKAQEVLQKLKTGGDFAELAAQYSLDEETKNSGGDLGWYSEDLLQPEFQQPITTLAAGQFSDPISTRGGYAIIQLLERGVRELDPYLIQQKQLKAVKDQVDALRTTATIEYLVDFTKDESESP